ncbi:hypothetical protein Hanom_Chr13g01202331 [Helianthus anomalus]
MQYSHHRIKESYETLKSETQRLQDKVSKYTDTTRFLEARYKGKQLVLNQYIDKVVEHKRQMDEIEQKNNKLQSYHASSYILEWIFNITPDDSDSENNKKGIGSKYHQVPPPLDKNDAFYDDKKVAKTMNMVDQLPENIDGTYPKSDDVSDSEVVSKVVESVLKEDSTKNDNSESQVEDEESFHNNYLKNSESKTNANDN